MQGVNFVDLPRRIQVVEGRWSVPITTPAPLLSSASIAWDGVLLVEHFCADAGDLNCGKWPAIVLHLQTGTAARHEWRSAGKLYKVLAGTGSTHLMPPGPERSLAYSDPTHGILLSIDPAFLQQALAESLTGGRLELVEKFAFEDIQIENLVKALHVETKAGAPTGRLFGQSLVGALAVYLAQRYSTSPPRFAAYRGGMPGVRLKRVLDYIGAKLDEDLSLLVLSNIAGMDLYYFAKLFKQSVGLSPHQYVLDQRIKRAKQLLLTPELTVFEVGVQTGFVDQSHFTKVFRSFVGLTPTKYRDQVK
jgi:AraC family transcriptional regulator